ncbi:MAG: 4-alpha-glucanotransferase [Bacilli bacterium]|nr:4-alpha-glucanotransferase [Bacilli bacterium]
MSIKKRRQAGILLHITSLPSKYGIGTLGKSAYEFVDFLHESKLSLWQILPLGPTSYGDSPYQSVSATALNYYLIDLEKLIEEGLLDKSFVDKIDFGDNPFRVDFSKIFNSRVLCLRKAFDNFNRGTIDFVHFLKSKDAHDFALFMTIKEKNNYAPWYLWDDKYKKYSPTVEEYVLKNHYDAYLFWVWTQYMFDKQFMKLKEYAHSKGVEIIGDIPLYIGYDSVEIWKYPEMFLLHKDQTLDIVAGCPPDAFSSIGQLWGNPCYDWKYMKQTNFAWWNLRINATFKYVDVLRIDHFRGFDRFYGIEAFRKDAVIGEWMDGPKFDLFADKKDYRIIAEDLGTIDDGVRSLLKKTGYPGMKILMFSFDGKDDNEHKPSNVLENNIIYTGTHDNDTLVQFLDKCDDYQYGILLNDLKKQCELFKVNSHFDDQNCVIDAMIELCFASKAIMCVIPMQDILKQGADCHMNLPNTVSTDNWSYRIVNTYNQKDIKEKLKSLVEKYNR